MKTKTLILLLLISIFPTIASGFTGKCVKVADGDTITVRGNSGEQTKVRLYGIDCPEKIQAFGQKAKRFTLKSTVNKFVTVDVIDTDRYGRSVGVVNVNGICVNSELLKKGLAWVYNRYCKKSFCNKWQQLEKKHELIKLVYGLSLLLCHLGIIEKVKSLVKQLLSVATITGILRAINSTVKDVSILTAIHALLFLKVRGKLQGRATLLVKFVSLKIRNAT